MYGDFKTLRQLAQEGCLNPELTRLMLETYEIPEQTDKLLVEDLTIQDTKIFIQCDCGHFKEAWVSPDNAMEQIATWLCFHDCDERCLITGIAEVVDQHDFWPRYLD